MIVVILQETSDIMLRSINEDEIFYQFLRIIQLQEHINIIISVVTDPS